MHVPVLLNEVIQFLQPEKCRRIIDATVNGGGHAGVILKFLPKDGILIGIDRDKDAIEKISENFKDDKRFHAVHGNFRNIKELTRKFGKVWDGILFDLGLSSNLLEESGRGFSFMKDEPLDMRFDAADRLTAKEIINNWPEIKLAEIFYKYGEERFSRKIAKGIVWRRNKSEISTTADLVGVIKESLPVIYLRKLRIHPATRVFQALRIAVNDELASLEDALKASWEILGKNGRLSAISFHSLEDRIVKQSFKNFKSFSGKAVILTKKPVVPSVGEVHVNPRARSAKLRVIQK